MENDAVIVRNIEGKGEVSIELIVPLTGKERKLARSTDEPIAKPLERIKLQILSWFPGVSSKGKSKKKRGDKHVGKDGPQITPEDIAW